MCCEPMKKTEQIQWTERGWQSEQYENTTICVGTQPVTRSQRRSAVLTARKKMATRYGSLDLKLKKRNSFTCRIVNLILSESTFSFKKIHLVVDVTICRPCDKTMCDQFMIGNLGDILSLHYNHRNLAPKLL